MTFLTRAAVVVLMASLLSACNQEKTNMIAFINMDELLAESGLLSQENAHMQLVKAALENGAKIAESRYPELSPEKAEAAKQSDTQALQLQWQSEQISARNAILHEVKDKAIALQKEKQLTAILSSNEALALDKKSDLTSILAEQLKSSHVIFGDLPQVSLKDGKEIR
ncbi:hypothetical protein GJV06_19210 [Enterobacteriaceae bacterium RIT691]|nr:hypothetical protein [Enterobacteriaceae bacterium RIT691]